MIVVFGGSGFIGAHLIDRLRAEGRQVEVVSHRPENRGRPGFRAGDLERPESFLAAVAGAEVVVQSTAFPSYPIEKPRRGHTFEAYDAVATERLVAAARRAGVRRYVYVAGVGAGPQATQPYFRAIHRGEEAVRGSGMSSAVLRPAFVYGRRDRGINRILGAARRTALLPIVGLAAMHQPVLVDDVADALARLAAPDGPRGTFEIGGPERMTMRAMLEAAFRYAEVRCRLVPVSRRIARLAAAVLARLPGEILSPSAIDFISEDFVADNGALRAVLPLTLTPFEAGIARYLRGPGRSW